jgi:hypothetical protein
MLLSIRTSLFYLKRNPRLPRYIQQVIHHRFQQRYSLLAADRLGFALWVAGDERAIGSRRGLRVSEDLNPVVDLPFELVFVDKTVGLRRPEKVTGDLAVRCA